jgi:hypothetical protein
MKTLNSPVSENNALYWTDMRYVDAEMNASDSIKLLEILSINHRKDM